MLYSNAKVYMIKYVFSKIMINFLNDFEQEQPACQPWSLVPILCVLVGLMTLIAIAFLANYINKTKNKKLLNGIILIYGLIFLGLKYIMKSNVTSSSGTMTSPAFPSSSAAYPSTYA